MTQVRSTLLGSSLISLRMRGLEDQYLAALPKQHHRTFANYRVAILFHCGQLDLYP